MIGPGRYSERRLSRNSVIYIDSSFTASGQVAGIDVPELELVQGNTYYLPSGCRMVVEHDAPIKITKIALADEPLLASTCIDLSMLPAVPKELNCSTVAMAFEVTKRVLMDDLIMAWPMLASSARQALSALVVSRIAPLASLGDLSPYGFTLEKRKKLANYVRVNLDQRILLADLADHVGMSKWHFARQFSAAYGISPMRYVVEMRILRAKDLLRTTAMSLAEIAMECGFSSQGHMSTAFSLVTGTTPRRYRRGM